MSAAEPPSHEDVDTCRICSMPSEDDRPLFYPCKCSGTIKYIHQDCLTTWLEHSKKKSCDVCKHQYSFTNVYAQDMPQHLPAHLVAKRVVRQIISAVFIFLRAMLVSLVWLAIVPYLTVITWRTYFWFGDVIAWWVNARPKPEPLAPPLGTLSWLGNLTTFILDADADAVDLHVSRDTAQAIARTISTDIFTGQIIATMIVLVFLCAFLLREWIMQNARPGLFEEHPNPEDLPALAPAAAVAPLPEVAPPVVAAPPHAGFLNEAELAAQRRILFPARPPTPPPERPATPHPRPGPGPSPLGEHTTRPGPIFVATPGTPSSTGQNKAPRRRSPSPSPGSTVASSIYRLDESDSDADDEKDETLSSPSRQRSDDSPRRTSVDHSADKVEFFPPNTRKGKLGSFDASRQAWIAFKGKQRQDSPQSSTASGFPSNSSVSVGGFEWPPLQDVPLTPVSARFHQNVPTTPLPSTFPSSATSSIPTPSSSIAPHSAATTTSPVVDHEPARMQIPPFTPSAFQFVVDPSPSTPSTLADSPEQERRPDVSMSAGRNLSLFSGDFPRSGSASSGAFESPLAPFTPSALQSSGDEQMSSPFVFSQTQKWPERTRALMSPDDIASTSNSGASPGPSSSSVDNTLGSIPPFTPSLFTFQGSPGQWPGPDTPAGLESASADKPFTFTFAQDVPGSSSFRLAATTPSRRPALAPATPSEEIPIALYRAPEDLENFEEENRKRQRSFTNAEMDHYFRRTNPDAVGEGTSTLGSAAPVATADAGSAGSGSGSGSGVRFSTDGDEFMPMLENMTDSEFDTDFEEQFDDFDDEDDDEDWEDMDGPAPARDAGGQALPAGGEARLDGEAGADGALPPADVNADEDLDGALEAVGMRGPLVIIFQNAAIAAVLLDLAIALGIWAPYTMGKTVGLLTLNPSRALTLLNMPIRAVRYVTDPIVDLCVTTVTNLVVPAALFLPRFLRFLIISGWFIASRFYIQASEMVHGSNAPTLRERELAFRARDQALLKFLHPNLSAVAYRFGNATARFLSLHQPSDTPIAAPLPAAKGSTWAMDLLTKLPVNQTAAEEYLRFAKDLGERSATRWITLVEGDGTAERVLAIALGYGLVLLAVACYLNTFTSANARSAGRAARNVVHQQLVVLKVAMFIVIELFMFPVGCGVLLDFCTLGMFPDATIQTRLLFLRHAPLTATFLHWLLGTTFMYQFALMLSACRTLMRPGAMWFVKDPQDPAAHPIRDIIDRPATSQLKKLSISVVMYTIVILVGVGCFVAVLLAFCSDLFPLRWNLREPLSEVPFELLFVHLVLPTTFKYMRIKAITRLFLEHWWKFMSHQLRLTSFMYGGRHPSEEYTPDCWTWRNPFNVGEPQPPEGMPLDGGFRRVPATDNVALPKDKKVVVPTDPNGNPLTVEGAAVIAAQVAEAEEAKRDPQTDYTVVYVPPRFGTRILVLMLFFWLTAGVVILFALSFPLRVGRAIIALCTDRLLHDVYSFTIGSYALAAGWIIGTELPTAARPWTLVRRFLLWAPQAAYMLFSIGVVLPTLLALFIELYLSLPIRMWLFPSTQPVIRLAHCWAVGLIMGRIALWTHRLPRADRNNEPEVRGVMHAWHAIERNGLLAPDVVRATREFIAPVGFCLATAIAIPAIVFVAVQKLMPVPIPAKLLPQAVYVSIFVVALMSGVIGSLADNASSWMQGVRDQEFLVERRLRNLEHRK